MYECTHMSWLAGTYESVESFERVQYDIFDAWPRDCTGQEYCSVSHGLHTARL